MAETKTISGRKLTEDEKKRVQEWAKTVGTGGMGCSFCGTHDWHTHDEFVELRMFHGGGLTLGGAIVPAVLFACAKCGHIELISAIATGIMKQDQEAKKANG